MRLATASFWLVMALGSTTLYRIESDRQREVERIAVQTAIAGRNPVAREVIRLAPDPDHAAAAFARAAVIDAVVASGGAAPEEVSQLVLRRSITAYLTPDLHPRDNYGAELLANQERLARAHQPGSPPARSFIVEQQLRAARELALDGLAVRPGFQDHSYSLEMLGAL